MAAMEYRRFVVYTLVGALAWAVGVTWAGYFLGRIFPDAGKYLEYIIAVIILASKFTEGAWIPALPRHSSIHLVSLLPTRSDP